MHLLTPEKSRKQWPARWIALLAACVLAIAAVEAAIMEVRTGLFSSGFGGARIDGVPGAVAFSVTATLLDAFLVLAIWLVVLPVLRWLGARRIRTVLLAGFLALVVPLSLDFARYVLESVLGRITSLTALWELSGRSVGEMVSQSLSQLPPEGLTLGVGAIGLVALGWWGGRLDERYATPYAAEEAPSAKSIAIGALVCALAGTLLLAAPLESLRPVQFGVSLKPSKLLLAEIVQRVSDVDRDGAGLLSRPIDPAPFDAAVYPFAIDIPGNGVDENGVGGDHPAASPAPALVRAEGPTTTNRPPVLLVFLETFRGDLVQQEIDGRPITPFLNELAERGVAIRRAYAHTPHTFKSRAQLFGGTFVPLADQPTIYSDFAALGYEIAHFSGQNDSFAGSEAYIGKRHADVFYDARDDIALHTGRGTSSGALQVSWKTLAMRVREFLAKRDSARPLLLYVNLVDTHFPFHHDELDPILYDDPVRRKDITPGNRDWIFRTYVNAAANVDRGIRDIYEDLRTSTGAEPVVLVTADHGEAFYETGFLGHGQSLDDAQTRVPFVVSGIGGSWPEPVGLADVRGLLLQNLGRPGPPQRVASPDRRVFQFLSHIDHPRQIAHAGPEQTWTYDLLDRPATTDPELLRLLFTWETIHRESEGLPDS